MPKRVVILTQSAVALALAGCAVHPLTPAPPATATRPPPAVVVLTAEPPVVALAQRLGAASTLPPAEAELLLTEAAGSAGLASAPTATPLPGVALSVASGPTTAPPAVALPPPTAVPVIAAVPAPAGDVAAAEQYCIDLINAQRAAVGVPALARDETLMGIARARVADMVARGYVGHNDPVTGEALARSMLQAAGYGNWVGENWYGSGTGPPRLVDIAMGWFMTDAPHYRNILNTNYSAVGIGIAFNGQQWLLVQNFAGP